MEKKLEQLLALKAKQNKAAEDGNPPSNQEAIDLRQALRAVEVAIQATERAEALYKAVTSNTVTSNPVTSNKVAPAPVASSNVTSEVVENG